MTPFRPLLIALLLIAAPARADVALLVHGWAADADTWLHGGVSAALEAGGWRDAGVLLAAPDGVRLMPGIGGAGANRAYRAALPAEAPLPLQAQLLLAQLDHLRALYPDEPLALIGHSAGGLVARLALVHPAAPRVDTLITIAAPHLGTVRAVEGLEVVESKPFFCPGPGIEMFKSFVGGGGYRYLRYSRNALVDLTPAVPGNLVDWLNRQPHPEIEYHAVVRQADPVVPPFSQDLNQVPVLAGRATLHPVSAPHELTPADGELLVRILKGLR